MMYGACPKRVSYAILKKEDSPVGVWRLALKASVVSGVKLNLDLSLRHCVPLVGSKKQGSFGG